MSLGCIYVFFFFLGNAKDERWRKTSFCDVSACVKAFAQLDINSAPSFKALMMLIHFAGMEEHDDIFQVESPQWY